ncbi:uncharacterized protein LOC121424096 [Lytechinus variegatus]|uniref:uncharacterized protein LOC121424096 n=1 Tax=Lytechinus variegatus TaxID=7654 RepID=UPI001BB202F3|nr:uncharacterized protein LOC121424096 [Lytechinus variegatus]
MDNNFRFPSLTEEDLASIVDDKDSTRTKGVISYSLNIVRSYCRQKEVDFAVLTERCSAPELNDFLRSFYAELRQGNGESYAKRSMITLRYGLQRHFLKHRQFDICKDAAFDGCNEMFKAILHKLKAEGKGAIRHKDPVTPEDMNKIRESFDLTVPKDLQNKVFLDLMLHLCNRGRENLRQMKKDDFAVQTDSANQRYVHVVRDMITKNHRGELNHDEESQGGRMYATGKSDCPVNSFLEYLSHLNENCDALWQRPKARRPAQSASPWYDNVPVGLHTLGNKMSVISKQAQCSKVYTNHCLRATAINKLDNAGFEARHIMAISGHRSENSIKHYSRVGESQKRRMSLTIASNNEEIATCSSTSDSAREVLRSSKFVRFSSTATTSNVPRSPSPPQEHAQSSQLVVNSQPTSSPININSSVSSRMHLHFNNCKVKIVCNQK